MSLKRNVLDLRKRKEIVLQGGGEEAIKKQAAMGKLTARERIEAILDKDSFHEYDMFVEHQSKDFDMDKKVLHGDGVIIGTGTIYGEPVCIYAQDFTVAGGSLGLMHARKITKIMDHALKMRVPLIGINDSGGARIQEGVDSLAGYGEIFFRNTQASGVIPQLSVILGPCAGGAVYSPALTDFVFVVENISKMFITGPNVIKTVLGEDISMEDLGGARVHAETTGNAHFYALSEQECFDQVKRLVSFIPWNNQERAKVVEPKEPSAMLNIEQVVPADPKQPYDVRDVIRCIVDDSDFLEIQELWAANIVIGFGRMAGETVGFVANQPMVLAGVLDCDSADKAARFIRFCDSFNIPIITLEDMPGYLPLAQNAALSELFAANVPVCAPGLAVERGLPFCGSTDMGDVSHLMPCVHPWVGCVTGTLHGADYVVSDEETAYVKTPEVLAMTLIDLLCDDAKEADRICREFKPVFTKETYLQFMDDLVRQH